MNKDLCKLHLMGRLHSNSGHVVAPERPDTVRVLRELR
jgi:hypothetical protein